MSHGMGGREEQSHQLFAAAREWGPGGLHTQHSHTEGPTVNSRVFLWGLCLLGVPEIREGPAAENSGYAADTDPRWLCLKSWLGEKPGDGRSP